MENGKEVKKDETKVVAEISDFYVEQYRKATPKANKFLLSDGSVVDEKDNLIVKSEFLKQQYDQAVPTPLKYLHSDGTIAAYDTYNVGQFKDDQLQGHNISGQVRTGDRSNPVGSGLCGDDYSHSSQALTSGTLVSDNINGTPRIGATTHGKQMGMLAVITY